MKTNKIITIILLGIIILSGIVRFWQLGSYPALNADEAAIGYNALSLLETGKDEHGNSWPIHFQSFNDYKPGLYFYLVMPFVATMGLNEWAVRIPNAALGVATVLLVYFLTKELFKDNIKPEDSKVGLLSNKNTMIALFSSFFLAISPWHMHFSRGGWEVNTATFFLTFGLYLFIRFVGNKKLSFLTTSGICYVLSLYTYHASRVIVPLLVLGLLAIYRTEIFGNIKKVSVAILISVLLLLPLGKDLMSGQVASRAMGVGLFADPGPLSRVNEQRGEHANYAGAGAKILHNKFINYSLAFLDNWADHYHGEFLFLSGEVIERNRVPETGQMYIFDLFLVVIGLVWLVRNKLRETSIVFWWLVIAPFAAALTFQSPHALRAQNMVVPLVIVAGVGMYSIVKWLSMHRRFSIVGLLSIVAIIVVGFTRYEHMYWVHMAKEYKFSSQYGVKELVNYIQNEGQSYPKVIVTDRYDQPYILFLFYLRYPPDLFQQDHVLLGRDRFGFSTVPKFGKYEFSSINFDTDRQKYPGYLMAGTPEEIPDETNIVKRIYGTNGYLYFEVVAN